MRKVLYVSDLDGTLLQSDASLSSYTASKINELANKGILFSYATARSLTTSQKVTEGINVSLPVIVHNGTFICDYKTKDILIGNYFEENVKEVILDLLQHHIYPIVYSMIDGKERFSYLKQNVSGDMKLFLDTRMNDWRIREVETINDLLQGNIYYITCIDEKDKLYPKYTQYKEIYHCVYDIDLYSKKQWLELMPKDVSKASAIKQLKEYLKCDYIIAFGDGKNDIEMFLEANECYAVSNACQELKAIATAVILSNDEDAVVKLIESRIEKGLG